MEIVRLKLQSNGKAELILLAPICTFFTTTPLLFKSSLLCLSYCSASVRRPFNLEATLRRNRLRNQHPYQSLMLSLHSRVQNCSITGFARQPCVSTQNIMECRVMEEMEGDGRSERHIGAVYITILVEILIPVSFEGLRDWRNYRVHSNVYETY